MSQFYGTLQGQGKTRATRRGSKNSGITVQAASWAGAVQVTVFEDHKGAERYVVQLIPWKGRGESKLLAEGRMGE